MPDFGARWKVVNDKPLDKGGQGLAFVVRDQLGADQRDYVAKVLSGPPEVDSTNPRWKRLEQEIEISLSFDHPNVVKVIDSGHTGKAGRPFFVMPLYPKGSLEDARKELGGPAKLLGFFAELCDGVAYVHSRGIVHRDLKPSNVFLDDSSHPIVGDFGLHFRFDAESLTETTEVATARWFGAPELRDGHLEKPTPAADVYSLGKILYWLFTGKKYDREEESYGTPERKLATVLGQSGAINTESGVVDDRLIHAGAFADDLVAETVRYRETDRLQNATELAKQARAALARFEAGGRALDLSESIPQRCLFCGTGGYKAIRGLPPLQVRQTHPRAENPMYPSHDSIYEGMRDAARQYGGVSLGVGVPIILICQHCGHVVQFRLDATPRQEALLRWRP